VVSALVTNSGTLIVTPFHYQPFFCQDRKQEIIKTISFGHMFSLFVADPICLTASHRGGGALGMEL
jgi:hypothetical protein